MGLQPYKPSVAESEGKKPSLASTLKIWSSVELSKNVPPKKIACKDLWGIELNWKKSDEGWDLARRHQYLNFVRMMKDQRKNIRKFTKLGYKVMKIPQNVYDLILSERQGNSKISL